jgi:hypothetical protein
MHAGPQSLLLFIRQITSVHGGQTFWPGVAAISLATPLMSAESHGPDSTAADRRSMESTDFLIIGRGETVGGSLERASTAIGPRLTSDLLFVEGDKNVYDTMLHDHHHHHHHPFPTTKTSTTATKMTTT